MQFKFETKRQGRCVAETEHRAGYIEVYIGYDQSTVPRSVTYELYITDEPLPKQIPEGGALQDATRIAINHFQAMTSKNGEVYTFRCSRITARWSGTLYNKLVR